MKVLNSVLVDHVLVCQAAEVLGVSERHTRRILAAYREVGAAALSHGHRGRRAPNTTSEKVKSLVVNLARTHYSETNHTHLSELLREREGVVIGRTTLRHLLAGLALEVRAAASSAAKADGSGGDAPTGRWESSQVAGRRGSKVRSTAGLDDATGTMPHALFSWQEDTRSYFRLMEELVRRRGIPLAIYSDRHGVFKFAGDVSDKQVWPTHFARAMEELGIRQIFARSPQAKGREERAAGTFQDRLVTELRLAGASAIGEANLVLKEFLIRFNQKFGVPAEQPKVAYRPLESSVSLGHILSFKRRRKVARDNSVPYKNRTLQLLPSRDRPS